MHLYEHYQLPQLLKYAVVSHSTISYFSVLFLVKERNVELDGKPLQL